MIDVELRTKLRVGKPVPLILERRFYQHVRDHSIKDVYDALVELVTNADDSYHRLYKRGKIAKDGGDVLIEYLEQRKGKPSQIIVRDRAEGMDSSDMEDRLLHLGRFSSGEGSRGYMGRGAKDCSALGDVTFDSIKDPETGKAMIREVDIDSDSYQVARHYMIRIEKSDFEDPGSVSRLATAGKMSVEEFERRFRYLINDPPIREGEGA